MKTLKTGLAIAGIAVLHFSAFAGEKKFYHSNSYAQGWAESHPNRKEAALINEKIASQPQAIWIDGIQSPSDCLGWEVKQAIKQGEVLPLILNDMERVENERYLPPLTIKGYGEWINDLANTIGTAEAFCFLEPNILASIRKISDEAKKAERYSVLSNAVVTLKKNANTKVYIAAPGWLSHEDLAESLKKSGIEAADGFCLNVCGFERTEKCIEFGEKLSDLVGGKHFVIDTSRNGNGPLIVDKKVVYVNPEGRALGERPTFDTGNPRVDAFAWMKRAGEPDDRKTADFTPFLPEYAYKLAVNAKW